MEGRMSNTVECPVCHGSGMTGASSCARCRGTGTVRAANESELAPEAVGDDIVSRVTPKRLKPKTISTKLASAGKKTGKGLSFKR
jgi:RecJ-like exonuclease